MFIPPVVGADLRKDRPSLTVSRAGIVEPHRPARRYSSRVLHVNILQRHCKKRSYFLLVHHWPRAETAFGRLTRRVKGRLHHCVLAPCCECECECVAFVGCDGLRGEALSLSYAHGWGQKGPTSAPLGPTKILCSAAKAGMVSASAAQAQAAALVE